jgi:hypothetical protein
MQGAAIGSAELSIGGWGEDMTENTRHFDGDPLLGVLAAAVLGPVGLAGALVSVASIVSALFGLGFLGEETPLDFLYGGGGFTFVRFLAFMAGGMVAMLCWAGIYWAFTGKKAASFERMTGG